jgi:transposase
MWAVLVEVADKNPDFLLSKTEFLTSSEASTLTKEKPKISQVYAEKQESYKLKQADYRKQQYQLQKQRKQGLKKPSKVKGQETPEFPEAVETALHYFSENGFPLQDSLNVESVGNARKKLARIFHPDRGGSHEEIVELNKYTDILLQYSEN